MPVDLYLPGCPPNPAAMIEALLMFLDRVPQRVEGRAPCRMSFLAIGVAAWIIAALLALDGSRADAGPRVARRSAGLRSSAWRSRRCPSPSRALVLPLGMGIVVVQPFSRRALAHGLRDAGGDPGGLARQPDQAQVELDLRRGVEPDRRARRVRVAGRGELPHRLGDHEPRRRGHDPRRGSRAEKGRPVLFMLGLLEAGAVALILAFILLAGHAGSIVVRRFCAARRRRCREGEQLFVGLLLLIGFGAKLGLLPFYEWFPGAYGAGSGATGALSVGRRPERRVLRARAAG